MTTRKTFSTVLITMIAAILLATSIFSPAPALAAAVEDYIVTAPALNLRTGPGFDFSVFRLLSQGQRVSFLSNSSNLLWSEVRLPDGAKGWVFNAYIEPVRVAEPGSAYVLVSRLNLRLGPGVSYRVLRLLDYGTELTVSGRNLASDWLAVELADGTDGWVYSPFIQTDANIASLPVLEAYGGPTSGGTGTSPQSINLLVTIRDNVAVVDVRGFPGNADLTVELGLPGEEPDLTVATGATAADGSARLTFQMPASWSDGTAVTQENLVVEVHTDDGSKTLKANIVYIR